MSDGTRPAFLSGPCPLAALIAEHDWAATPLGPVERWPAYLRTVVGTMLASPLPIATLWGAEGVLIYNDGYARFAGHRHPAILGMNIRDAWPEARDFNDTVVRQVFGAGRTLSFKDERLMLDLHGTPEPVWLNLDYSPIPDEDGRPAGVLALLVETTGKVRAEQRAIGERERLQRKFEQSPGFTATLDGPDHLIDFANRAFKELFHRRELVGTPAREALPRLWEQGLGTLLDHVFSTGQPFSARSMAVTLDEADGSDPRQAFLDFTCQPLRDEGGRVSGIFVTGYDVTELRRARERLDLAQRAGGVGTFELYPDARTLSVSAEFCRLWGLPVTEEVGLDDLVAMLHPDDQPRLRSTSEDIGQVSLGYIEYRIRRADTGEEHWIARRGERVEADDLPRFAGVVYDITHMKLAEEQLQRLNTTLEERVAQRSADLDRMWRLTTDLMLVADFTGAIQAVNPAWSVMLGWDEADLLGQVLLDFVHPDDRAPTLAEVGTLGRGISTLRFENRYRHKDGRYRWISWTAVPDAQFIHAVGRDIQSEKEAEARLEQAHEALRQSQKMEAVGQLTGGIAHDFNNLLTVVTGNIDMAGRALDAAHVEDARSRRALDNAMKGATRAATLTQRLLAFSRRQPLAPRAIDVDRLLAGMSDLLNRSLGETIRLELVTAPGLWRVEADPNQLESAILNLAVNARDAMPGGGDLLIETANARLDEEYVASQAEVAPGQYVVIAVTDTGEGMDRGTLTRVFEPFFTTKEVGKGTGLGLSMVYGFVKQSGGNVKVYSEEGRGTTVKIYLPRLLSEAASDEEEALVIAGLEVSARRETVLAVEDDDDVRAYTVECLRELGYRVLEAHDGPSALRLLERQEEQIDLLFTDVVMPGMSGSELAHAARERQPALKVLYTSGYTRNAIVHGGRLDPGVEMIPKPFAFSALAQKVRDVLDAGRTGRVLVIDGEANARLALVEALHAAGYAADEASTAAEGLAALRSAQGRFDAVVIDTGVGDGLATELRALHADLPILLLLPDEARAVAARPADRCTATLVKPFTPAVLTEALSAVVQRCERA